ncbi:MAG: hypothetical protein JO015_11800 [Verrucomicrobia bacterium]|nr:hypothetical protein [Verrucomicrobiota bacterium]
MVRFLLTLALLCALGTVGFGYFNRAKLGRLVQDLASVRQENDRTKAAMAQLQQRFKGGEERQAGELKIMQDQQQKLTADLTATKAHLSRATEQLDLRDKENKALTAALTQAGQNIEQKQRAESERNALAGRLIRVEDTLNQFRLNLEATPAAKGKPKAGLPVEGTIISMNPGAQALTISLGSDAGLAPNARLTVLKNGVTLSQLRVVSVEKDSCVAEFISAAPENFSKVAVGDPVTLAIR